jgi:hypothetical protein
MILSPTVFLAASCTRRNQKVFAPILAEARLEKGSKNASCGFGVNTRGY